MEVYGSQSELLSWDCFKTEKFDVLVYARTETYKILTLIHNNLETLKLSRPLAQQIAELKAVISALLSFWTSK
jgi:hypothetical protein